MLANRRAITASVVLGLNSGLSYPLSPHACYGVLEHLTGHIEAFLATL